MTTTSTDPIAKSGTSHLIQAFSSFSVNDHSSLDESIDDEYDEDDSISFSPSSTSHSGSSGSGIRSEVSSQSGEDTIPLIQSPSSRLESFVNVDTRSISKAEYYTLFTSDNIRSRWFEEDIGNSYVPRPTSNEGSVYYFVPRGTALKTQSEIYFKYHESSGNGVCLIRQNKKFTSEVGPRQHRTVVQLDDALEDHPAYLVELHHLVWTGSLTCWEVDDAHYVFTSTDEHVAFVGCPRSAKDSQWIRIACAPRHSETFSTVFYTSDDAPVYQNVNIRADDSDHLPLLSANKLCVAFGDGTEQVWKRRVHERCQLDVVVASLLNNCTELLNGSEYSSNIWTSIADMAVVNNRKYIGLDHVVQIESDDGDIPQQGGQRSAILAGLAYDRSGGAQLSIIFGCLVPDRDAIKTIEVGMDTVEPLFSWLCSKRYTTSKVKDSRSFICINNDMYHRLCSFVGANNLTIFDLCALGDAEGVRDRIRQQPDLASHKHAGLTLVDVARKYKNEKTIDVLQNITSHPYLLPRGAFHSNPDSLSSLSSSLSSSSTYSSSSSSSSSSSFYPTTLAPATLCRSFKLKQCRLKENCKFAHVPEHEIKYVKQDKLRVQNMGRVLGKGKYHLKEMRLKSGAQIIPDDNELLIIGRPEQIQQAATMAKFMDNAKSFSHIEKFVPPHEPHIKVCFIESSKSTMASKTHKIPIFTGPGVNMMEARTPYRSFIMKEYPRMLAPLVSFGGIIRIAARFGKTSLPISELKSFPSPPIPASLIIPQMVDRSLSSEFFIRSIKSDPLSVVVGDLARVKERFMFKCSLSRDKTVVPSPIELRVVFDEEKGDLRMTRCNSQFSKHLNCDYVSMRKDRIDIRVSLQTSEFVPQEFIGSSHPTFKLAEKFMATLRVERNRDTEELQIFQKYDPRFFVAMIRHKKIKSYKSLDGLHFVDFTDVDIFTQDTRIGHNARDEIPLSFQTRSTEVEVSSILWRQAFKYNKGLGKKKDAVQHNSWTPHDLMNERNMTSFLDLVFRVADIIDGEAIPSPSSSSPSSRSPPTSSSPLAVPSAIAKDTPLDAQIRSVLNVRAGGGEGMSAVEISLALYGSYVKKSEINIALYKMQKVERQEGTPPRWWKII
eukprot:TRINITY_DN4483_c2_g1_i2.p1 TRINITY_DN4483_c2_g1~~TRINITY_DN4483_c2_g1_i2.p1  ORF type:complete len:1171 (-),score=133.71 TRINITY_DN4483_c2_g1_i2:24-3362(-)